MLGLHALGSIPLGGINKVIAVSLFDTPLALINYVIPTNRRLEIRKIFSFKGEVHSINFELAPWEEDNGVVTSATWTVKSGKATIANKLLLANQAYSEITTAFTGTSLIELTLTAGSNVFVTHLEIQAKK